MPDNLAFQLHRGNWILHEDAETVTDLQAPTTTTSGTAYPTAPTRTCRATAASASPP
jgi:hypothetical protein